MRRIDREITDKSEIIKIIDKCGVCRIALSQNNIPYIVPMNFGYEYDNYTSRLMLYFHCAKEGRKLDIIKENSTVCFECDCSHRLMSGEKAHNFSMEYESVIGDGNIVIVGDAETDEKYKALGLIMKKYAPEKTFEFSETDINSVTILKLTVSGFTGKRNIKT